MASYAAANGLDELAREAFSIAARLDASIGGEKAEFEALLKMSGK